MGFVHSEQSKSVTFLIRFVAGRLSHLNILLEIDTTRACMSHLKAPLGSGVQRDFSPINKSGIPFKKKGSFAVVTVLLLENRIWRLARPFMGHKRERSSNMADGNPSQIRSDMRHHSEAGARARRTQEIGRTDTTRPSFGRTVHVCPVCVRLYGKGSRDLGGKRLDSFSWKCCV